ncbi:MAG: ATP-binding protein [Anaerovoracaceae bacterium]
MMRKIIHIDEDKCNGCGACAEACHEGAIGMINGKARLLRDDYCDGLGDCLPTCPTGAITFVRREAAAYDEEAVKTHMEKKNAREQSLQSCPGAAAKALKPAKTPAEEQNVGAAQTSSQLQNWPVQIKLAPLKAPYFDGANLLIAADCTAYAYADFHTDFMRNRVTLIGCPKLDAVDYAEKLSEIIKQNDIASISVIRMEVPCCGGLSAAVQKAISDSGKMLPVQVVTISIEGGIING